MVRAIRNNKAWMRVVEITLSMVLVFAYLMYLQNIQTTEQTQPSKWGRVLLRMYGEDILRTLYVKDEDIDYLSDLETQVNNSDWNAIDANISKMMPDNVDYTLYLVDRATGTYTWKTGVSEAGIPALKELIAVEQTIKKGGDCTSNRCYLHMVLWYKQ